MNKRKAKKQLKKFLEESEKIGRSYHNIMRHPLIIRRLPYYLRPDNNIAPIGPAGYGLYKIKKTPEEIVGDINRRIIEAKHLLQSTE